MQQAPTNTLLKIVQEALQKQVKPLEGSVPPYVLFASLSDGFQKAITFSVKAANFKDGWKALCERTCQEAFRLGETTLWLRVDWVKSVEKISWKELNRRLSQTKRNYFRAGISLDRQFQAAFPETELNANAMLYGGVNIDTAIINRGNFLRYMKARNLGDRLDIGDDDDVYQFSTAGFFISSDDLVLHTLETKAGNGGRRQIEQLDQKNVYELIASSSRFLSSQVKEDGRFIYGWHPCFDREIDAYNCLRHASTLYSMIDAWDITRDNELKSAIDRSLYCLTIELINVLERDGQKVAFLVDQGGEIKLGGNAVCLLALVKYTEVMGDHQYLELMAQLAAGILFTQDPESGKFAHILQYPELTVKESFRIIYYDGEAAFGLMRLYSVTKDPKILKAVEKAFGYFIEADHWKAHDHWLSYATNELTRYLPEARYFEFGLKNFADYLDFVTNRITTFPTLLELMMAAQEMVRRLQAMPEMSFLLHKINLEQFYHALETRAYYLLNGYFWPEMAMFFANPARIKGSFFIRHHAFRVRIDDVEHYLSGYCAYLKYLRAKDEKGEAAS